MPTEQVLRWHLRIMMQPMAISGVVAKPNSSAPSSAAITTSRPVCSLPSVCTRMRLRKIVQQKNLLRFREAEFPRNAGMLDGTQRRRAGAARVSADQNHVGMCLCHACRDRAHPDFGHKFNGDAGVRIDVLQVVDQLREIFDRVNVVVRRRRNQADARDGMAQTSDYIVDLVARKLATLAGFRALRHLDLQFVGVDQVVCRDAEAGRGHLFYRTAPQIAVRVSLEALFVFSTLAGVRLAADAVHCDGQRFVRLFLK